jgi:two-component system probable response regulator PhcQ
MEHIVLLVDDDKNVIHGLTRALRRQPYQIYTAQSGDEATWILKAHEIDVIVTDEKMPGMSGCELLAWVAEHYPEVVRILLTGHASTETAIRAINEGAVYHIFTKPCRDVHLAVAIRKALEQRELLRENLRLRDVRRREAAASEHLLQSLEDLVQVVSDGLWKPLQAMADLDPSADGEGRKASDPDAKTLLDGALSTSAEVQRVVTDLLKHCRDQRTGTAVNQTGGECLAQST